MLSSDVPLKVVASCLDTLQPVILEDFADAQDLETCLRASANVPEVSADSAAPSGGALVSSFMHVCQYKTSAVPASTAGRWVLPVVMWLIQDEATLSLGLWEPSSGAWTCIFTHVSDTMAAWRRLLGGPFCTGGRASWTQLCLRRCPLGLPLRMAAPTSSPSAPGRPYSEPADYLVACLAPASVMPRSCTACRIGTGCMCLFSVAWYLS